jgi:hypothetical protein
MLVLMWLKSVRGTFSLIVETLMYLLQFIEIFSSFFFVILDLSFLNICRLRDESGHIIEHTQVIIYLLRVIFLFVMFPYYFN